MTDSGSHRWNEDLLWQARGPSERAKAEKLAAKIGAGKQKLPKLLADAGFYTIKGRSMNTSAHAKRPERDVMAAAVEALPPGSFEYLHTVLFDYNEEQYLSLLDRGLARDVKVNAEMVPNQPSPGHLLPLDLAWGGGGPAIRELLRGAGAKQTDPETASKEFLRKFSYAAGFGWIRRLRMASLASVEVVVSGRGGDAELAELTSRYGGKPNLPSSDLWPTQDGAKLLFLGQLLLSDIKKPTLPLPESGLLLFFVAKDGGQSGRVVYVPEPTESAVDGPRLLKKSYGLKFKRPKPKNLPMPNNFYWASLMSHSLEDAESNPYARKDLHVVLGENACHQIGGHPFQLQADDRPRQAKARGIADPCLVVPLLQVDQFPRGEEMCWGDNGIGHFFCGLDALRDRRFDEAWFTWNSY